MLYLKLSSILLFDITTNSAPHAPQNICKLFTSIHRTYISIIPAQHLLVTTILIILGSIIIKTLFSIGGAKIWNSIPESYRRLAKHIFKKKIQALLILTLETLDSYA